MLRGGNNVVKKQSGLGFPRPGLCFKPSLTGNFPRKCQQDCFERDDLRSIGAWAQEYVGNQESCRSSGNQLPARVGALLFRMRAS